MKSIVMHLTGGPRPLFEEGFNNAPLHNVVWDALGRSGDLDGILSANKNIVDTKRIVYRFDAAEPIIKAFNASIVRASADTDANPMRKDGLRWIPKINGEFSVPVLSIHTLGDMYVPFMMEQIYRQRATVKGTQANLVQRAIRAPGHCDFTIIEQSSAFADMVKWVETGVKPAGDDVLTASVLAQPNYGCTHTNNSTGMDDRPVVKSSRSNGTLPACQ